MSISCKINVETEKFRNRLIDLKIILELMEKIEVIERLEKEKIKEIARKELKKLRIKNRGSRT